MNRCSRYMICFHCVINRYPSPRRSHTWTRLWERRGAAAPAVDIEHLATGIGVGRGGGEGLTGGGHAATCLELTRRQSMPPSLHCQSPVSARVISCLAGTAHQGCGTRWGATRDCKWRRETAEGDGGRTCVEDRAGAERCPLSPGCPAGDIWPSKVPVLPLENETHVFWSLVRITDR